MKWATESERRQTLEHAIDAMRLTDEVLNANYGPGGLGTHELTDHAHLSLMFFLQSVLRHPSCVMRPVLFDRATRIVNMLEDLERRCRDEEEKGLEENGGGLGKLVPGE